MRVSQTWSGSSGGGLDQPRQLAQRAGRDVRLELLGDRRLELGPLDREPVGVGGDHRQLVSLGGDQDAGQDRPRLVARRGPGDAVDRLLERVGRQLDGIALGLGEAGEVVGGERAQVELGGAGGDLDVALGLAQLEA